MDAFELRRIQSSAEEALARLEDPATIEDGAAILNLLEASVKMILKNQAAIAQHLADAPTITDTFGNPLG